MAVRNVLVLGGSGRVGQCIVSRLLPKEDGDEPDNSKTRAATSSPPTECRIVITSRTPKSYNGRRHARLTVVPCDDLFDPEAIREILDEHCIDVILSCLAFPPGRGEEYSEGYAKNARAAVEAMRRSSSRCRRLVVVSGWYVTHESRTWENLSFPVWFVLHAVPWFSGMLQKVHEGHLRADEYLRGLGDEGDGGINWTSCRSPILEFGKAPPDQLGFRTAVGGDYVDGCNFWKGSTDDLARFMIDVMENDLFPKQIVAFGRDEGEDN